MTRPRLRGPVFAGLLALVAAGLASAAGAQSAPPGVFRVDVVAERSVAALPEGPLFWRVESAPSPFTAPAAGEPFSLTAEAKGRTWLFSLGPQGARTPDTRLEAEIGPVPLPSAPSGYTLRLNRAGGSPGSKTPVHFHPGSEAFVVLSGRLCQHTSHGDAEVGAGQSMNGHAPGAIMQLTSCGEADLDQWVMFVLDSSQPFSTPASFD